MRRELPDDDDDDNFALRYLRRAKRISKKYRVSAQDNFAIASEISAAAFIFEATEEDYLQLEKGLEALKQVSGGVMAYLMAKGAITMLMERGVNASNAEEYMDNRIREFEEVARSRTGVN